MNKVALAKLVEDCRNAKVAGLLAIRDIPDDGSCNFDSPFIIVKPFGKKDEEALKTVGVEVCKIGRRVILSFGFVGQANRNCKYAETIADFLEACGWETGVRYILD
jgi:hypothetical protein